MAKLKAWLIGFTAACVTSVGAWAAAFDPADYSTAAEFGFVIQKSEYLRLGTNKFVGKSAFVTLVHGWQRGKMNGKLIEVDALKVWFFTRPLTAADLPDIVTNEAEELRKSSYAQLVLLLDKDNNVYDVNLMQVIPGTTLGRPIASTPEDLKRSFSLIEFSNGRLRLKGHGTHAEKPPEPDEFTITWNVDLDLPVKHEMTR